jgi:hypothetical protein
MGKPLPSDVHIDVALSNLSIKYQNAELVGERLFPPLVVDKDSNKYFIYGKENMRTYRTKRAPGTRAASMDWSVSSDSFKCEEYALEHPIPDEVRNEADAPLKPESDAAEMLSDTLMLDHEVRIATLATTSGSFASGHANAAAKKWDDFSASDPIEDVRAMNSLIHGKIMKPANVILLGKQVYDVLRNHPAILARLSDSNTRIVTPALLAMLFDVQEVLVGGARQITSVEGAATEVSSYVWGKNVVLAYKGNPGLKTITFGQVFRRQGYRQVEKWREQAIKSDILKVADKTDEKIIASGAGALLSAVVA